jgi:hypothetical protein
MSGAVCIINRGIVGGNMSGVSIVNHVIVSGIISGNVRGIVSGVVFVIIKRIF